MILSVVNHARQLVGTDVETHVLRLVQMYARAVLLYAIHHVKQNAKMQLDILA